MHQSHVLHILLFVVFQMVDYSISHGNVPQRLAT